MLVSDFQYGLPDNLIADQPQKTRGQSRLLVLEKTTGQVEHRRYYDVTEYLKPGDVVVLNNTKVIKARLLARNKKGQDRELLLLEDHHNIDPYQRKCLYRGKLHINEELAVKKSKVIVMEILSGGVALVRSETPLLDIAEHEGKVPLPPYIKRQATKKDESRYQTVFAKYPGSVAAPTASLNFTEELTQRLNRKGVDVVYLTLHVGIGTFLPIRGEEIEKHNMHSEYFEIPKETVRVIQTAKLNNRKVLAVGTTVARTLEFTSKQLSGSPQDLSGEANIFIYPGYEFKVVDALLTNFHAPKTTVLMLAAAFAGWNHLKTAYEEATKLEYAFLSYGDSMLIT